MDKPTKNCAIGGVAKRAWETELMKQLLCKFLSPLMYGAVIAGVERSLLLVSWCFGVKCLVKCGKKDGVVVVVGVKKRLEKRAWSCRAFSGVASAA